MIMCSEAIDAFSLQYGKLQLDREITLQSAKGVNYEIITCFDGVLVIRKSNIVSRYKVFSAEEMNTVKKQFLDESSDIIASQIVSGSDNNLQFSVNIPLVIDPEGFSVERTIREINKTFGIWIEDGLSFTIDMELSVATLDVSNEEFTSNYLWALLSVIRKIKSSAK